MVGKLFVIINSTQKQAMNLAKRHARNLKTFLSVCLKLREGLLNTCKPQEYMINSR
jgi:hypothetical protein